MTTGTSEVGIRNKVDLFMEYVVRRIEPPKQNASHSEVKQTSTAAEGSAETGINAAKDKVEEGGRKSSCDNVMVLTRGQSGERGEHTTIQHLQTAGTDPRSQSQTIDGQEYAASFRFDDLLPEDIRRIATMPLF